MLTFYAIILFVVLGLLFIFFWIYPVCNLSHKIICVQCNPDLRKLFSDLINSFKSGCHCIIFLLRLKLCWLPTFFFMQWNVPKLKTRKSHKHSHLKSHIALTNCLVRPNWPGASSEKRHIAFGTMPHMSFSVPFGPLLLVWLGTLLPTTTKPP